ncbi:helix-turn-helix domain-containing protein [Hymenobacter sp. DG25B]|uniref:helix-turn-helix domain-containing protein n=1 Tax=Hymenobacter sp. DG25B TaxID=1385664 RepID=UPI000662BC9D|nr:helix-turn-helix domain-containing protein [Hymenobacter sp. DG25B]
MFSAERILIIRKSKGLSQELLAEQSGISLRTIQRVEQGDTVPRGHTLQALAAALEVPLDALREEPQPTALATPPPAVGPTDTTAAAATPVLLTAPTLRSDPQYLQLLNLSALSFLVFPFLNLVVPFLLWRAHRLDTEHVAEVGRRVLGFQILWQAASFLLFALALVAQIIAFRYFNRKLPGVYVAIAALTYAVNALTVIYYNRKLKQGSLDLYPIRL